MTSFRASLSLLLVGVALSVMLSLITILIIAIPFFPPLLTFQLILGITWLLALFVPQFLLLVGVFMLPIPSVRVLLGLILGATAITVLTWAPLTSYLLDLIWGQPLPTRTVRAFTAMPGVIALLGYLVVVAQIRSALKIQPTDAPPPTAVADRP